MEMPTTIPPRSRLGSVLGGMVCAGLLLAVSAGSTERHTEKPRDVMAGYLGQFPAYVEWPTNTFGSATEPWRIGILGADTFGEELQKLLQGRQVAGRGFEIRRATKLPELPPCEIIFIAGKDAKEIRKILKQLGSRPVLTVSEHDNFLALGGMIQLQTRDTVRMLIDLDHAHAAKLRIRCKLLEVASEVNENGGRRILRK